ncbi:DNA repair protein [Vibrio sp. F13]|nr:DNA repair protein [Vibrio sp. F13]
MQSLKRWFSKESELDAGLQANELSKKRNQIITAITLVIFASMFFAFKHFKKPRTDLSTSSKTEAPAPDFGEIINDDFTEKDNRSALTIQRQEIEDTREEVERLNQTMTRLISSNENTVAQLKKQNNELTEALRDNREAQRTAPHQSTFDLDESQSDTTQTLEGDNFGSRPLPPKPAPSYSTDDLHKDDFQYTASDTVSFDNQGQAIDSFDFHWESGEKESYRRTTENYVPSGTFVTARITGGADANAGVFGQSDTVPIVLQTVHEGILPNGEKTHLMDCTIVGSVYGDLSSSRGVARTNTISCIRDGNILDIPVQGTVFNFGRNGIRGTSILRNGKIIQMAGISGILTGLGETGAGLASTTSTSALGSTSSINSEDVGLSLLGNATSEVGSKLSDYYIALAELYHPFIEINPGGLVNIVFTQGFPLDDEGVERYEEKLANEQTQPSTIMETITLNPLANELTPQLR